MGRKVIYCVLAGLPKHSSEGFQTFTECRSMYPPLR